MESLINWILENKSWLFSGIAITIPIALISWALASRKNSQRQKGGHNSTNIQVGGSINIKAGKDTDD